MIKIPHLVSWYKERNNFKTEDPTVAHPVGKYAGPGAPSPTTLQHQPDTSVKHLPCWKLDLKDQTRGGTHSPGQHSNSSPLKTLGKSNPVDRSSAASAVTALDQPGRGSNFWETSQSGKWEGKGAKGGDRVWCIRTWSNGRKCYPRNSRFNYNQTPIWHHWDSQESGTLGKQCISWVQWDYLILFHCF